MNAVYGPFAILKNVAKRASILKAVHPHNFRHSLTLDDKIAGNLMKSSLEPRTNHSEMGLLSSDDAYNLSTTQ